MIKLLLSDVDGVMTDGGVTFTSSAGGAAGGQTMTFSIRDGLGVKLWQGAGREFGIVTGRDTPMVAERAAALGIELLYQGRFQKLPTVEQIAADRGLAMDEIAYVGDDLPDLPVIRAVGLGVAVADAVDEVQAAADHVLTTPGGYGAVRELIETILKDDGAWDAVLESF
ncbi:MAG: HAD hydrolase family protein [Planctomycetota bacterium]